MNGGGDREPIKSGLFSKWAHNLFNFAAGLPSPAGTWYRLLLWLAMVVLLSYIVFDSFFQRKKLFAVKNCRICAFCLVWLLIRKTMNNVSRIASSFKQLQVKIISHYILRITIP